MLLSMFHAGNRDFVINLRLDSIDLRIIIFLGKMLLATDDMRRRMAKRRIDVNLVVTLVVSRSMVDVLLLRALMVPLKLIHVLRRLLELLVLKSIVGWILHWKAVKLASESASLTSLNSK